MRAVGFGALPMGHEDRTLLKCGRQMRRCSCAWPQADGGRPPLTCMPWREAVVLNPCVKAWREGVQATRTAPPRRPAPLRRWRRSRPRHRGCGARRAAPTWTACWGPRGPRRARPSPARAAAAAAAGWTAAGYQPPWSMGRFLAARRVRDSRGMMRRPGTSRRGACARRRAARTAPAPPPAVRAGWAGPRWASHCELSAADVPVPPLLRVHHFLGQLTFFFYQKC
jgi:hypothetical protein